MSEYSNATWVILLKRDNLTAVVGLVAPPCVEWAYRMAECHLASTTNPVWLNWEVVKLLDYIPDTDYKPEIIWTHINWGG